MALLGSQRVLAKLDTSGGLDACWPFMGSRTQDGYGLINRRTYGMDLAHRFVFWLATGLSPAVVMHECDNPPCCNPLHLTDGTHSENARQAYARGRRVPRGPSTKLRSDARLSEDDVGEIRRLVASGVSQADVARRYGIDPGYVSQIVNFKRRRAA